MDVEVELPGPGAEPHEDEQADRDDTQDQDRKRRETSSPLSSLPPSQDPSSLSLGQPQNGTGSKRKQADHLTIKTDDPLATTSSKHEDSSTPDTPRLSISATTTTTTTTGRALRSRMTSHQPTKQKAQEMDSPRPKKRAATVGTRSQVAAPAATVEESVAEAPGSTRTRSSARLRKR